MSVTPTWQHQIHGDEHGDRWNCTACSIFMETPPPLPLGYAADQPDTRPRWWSPKGELSPEFDPCGAGPIRAVSDDGRAA